MKDEKELFLQKCNDEDRDKLLGKCRMTYEDFERLFYLASYYGYTKYGMEIYETFVTNFREREEALFSLWKEEEWTEAVEEEIEVEIEKREEWIKTFEERNK